MDRGPWIQTYSGKAFHLLDPRPEEVDLADIAHALSLKCRFTGHTRYHYSVAQHCVLGAGQLPEGPLRLAFLLHELDEVWLPDVASPLKPYLMIDGMRWNELGQRHANVACRALGLEPVRLHHASVREMDIRMLLAERDALLGPALPGWGTEFAHLKPAPVWIRQLTPAAAEQAWRAAFQEARQ